MHFAANKKKNQLLLERDEQSYRCRHLLCERDPVGGRPLDGAEFRKGSIIHGKSLITSGTAGSLGVAHDRWVTFNLSLALGLQRQM